MKQLRMIFVLLALSSVLSGCSFFCWLCELGKPSSRVKVSPGPPVVFSGKVVSNFNETLAGATVEVNGHTATANKDGVFTVPVKLAGRYVVNIQKDGYGLYSRNYVAAVENKTWMLTKATVWENLDPNTAIDVKDNLSIEGCQGSKRRPPNWDASKMYEYRTRTRELKTTFDALAKAAFKPTQCSPGIKIAIPPGSLQYKDGQALSAADRVKVSLATVDLFSPDGMPGDFVFIRRDQYETTQAGFMESYGAGSVTVAANGKPVNLKSGATAKLVIPVDPNKDIPPPDTIPLLVYDEAHGVWSHEGTATLNASKDAYLADVSHFSEYNADVEFGEPACVKVDARAIGQTFDLHQHVIGADAAGNPTTDYHFKLHPNVQPGLHAVYALPPIDNLPLNQGLSQPRTGHQVILEAWEPGTCSIDGAPTCKAIDFVTIAPNPPRTADLPKQTGPVVPVYDYAACQSTVALYKDASAAGAPTSLTTDVRPWGVVSAWNYSFDPLIAADNNDGFVLEEAVCTANCTGSPTWGPWQVPLQLGTATPVLYANTANDGNAATNRAVSAQVNSFMRQITVPRLKGLYKYRVKAYYGATSQFTAYSPEVTAFVSDAQLVVENLMSNSADDANWNDDNILRFRIEKTQTALTSGAVPERLEADSYCSSTAPVKWISPGGAPRTELVLNEAPHYFVWLELGYWYLLPPGIIENKVDPDSGKQCVGVSWYKRMYGKEALNDSAHLHRSIGGQVILPPPAGSITTNYLEVTGHYGETIKIQLTGNPQSPTIKVFDENNNDITSANQFRLVPNQTEQISGW